MNENKNNINWYPGHMAKARRKINEHLKLVDVVYEVIDARMPLSSRIKDIDEIVKNKPRIIVMSKTDLCDLNETNKWINYFKTKGHELIELNLNANVNIDPLIRKTNEMAFHINEKRKAQGMKSRKIRVMVIGIPNVGKSSLINRLSGKKTTRVGNKPGITTSLDWIRINNDLELMDTPGILWPKLDDKTIAYNLASLTSIKEEILPLDEIAFYILKTLYIYYPKSLEERYNIKEIDFENIVSTYDAIGKKFGCLIKGGEIDYDKVISIIINDLKNGVIKNVTFDRFDNYESK